MKTNLDQSRIILLLNFFWSGIFFLCAEIFPSASFQISSGAVLIGALFTTFNMELYARVINGLLSQRASKQGVFFFFGLKIALLLFLVMLLFGSARPDFVSVALGILVFIPSSMSFLALRRFNIIAIA